MGKSKIKKSSSQIEEIRQQKNNDMFVVGIGASAGGLDALQAFFNHIPLNTGMTFCVVQHLSPDFKSLMDELLGRHSKLKISTAKDGETLEPNRIYLNPNHSSLIIKNGKFVYVPKEARGTINLPIDLFLHSLANEYGEKSIGIILSGTGTDGSRGIKTIKEVGGTIMVQSPLSAQFDGMPNTAIATGYAEYVNTPEGLAEEVVKFPYKPSFYGEINKGSTPTETEMIFLKILEEIRKNTGVDFKLYKNNTLVRRLEKRMGVLNISKINEYYELIKKNKEEPDILMKDFFIGVTSFFRDKLAWQAVKTDVLPEIFKNKEPHDTIRLWSVGCSTGEEAFSLAMMLDEYIKENELKNDFKIFATDIDIRAIEIASKGEYIVNEIRDLSQNRLETYFSRIGDKYQISKKIREKIVFSTHNIIKNPPFIKMDLISCRNLLIYLLPKTQQRIYQHFQFSLNLNAYLFLGSSENLGDAQQDFETINNKWRIYSCKNKKTTLPFLKQGEQLESIELTNPRLHITTRTIEKKIATEALFINHLNNTFSPKCIFIDSDYNILYINGDLKSFLEIPQGIFQVNLLKMLDDKLAAMIRNGVRRLKEENKEIVFNNIQALLKNQAKTVNLTFSKLEDNSDISLITFDEKDIDNEKAIIYDQYELDEFSKQRIEDLEVELKSKQEELQYVIEEIETSNEELQAANEELQAANEELQGTNEELQSVNEELYTVNTELQSKNRELNDLNNDMNNLLSSTHIGTLFLDNKLNIRKITPALKKHFNLEENDVGRSITSFTHRFQNRSEKEFIDDIKQVILTGKELELEVINQEGLVYIKRIMPFTSHTKQIDGAVITFVDVTKLKEAQEEILNTSNQIKLILENVGEGIYGLDLNGNCTFINPAAAKILGYTIDELHGKHMHNNHHYKKSDGSDYFVEECYIYKAFKEGKKHFVNDEVFWRKDGSSLNVEYTSTPIIEKGEIKGAVVVFKDITERIKIDKKEKKLLEEITISNNNLNSKNIELFKLTKELELIIDHFPGLIFYKDNKNNFLKVNKFMADAYQKEKSEIEGKNLLELHTPELAQKYWDDDLEVIKSGESKLNIIEPWETHEGNKWVNTSKILITNPIDNSLNILGISSDITELKRLEESWKNSEERFRSMFDTSPDSIMVYDKDYKYLYINKTACKYLGVESSELAGKYIDEVMKATPDIIPVWKSRIDNTFETKEVSKHYDEFIDDDFEMYSESTFIPIENSLKEVMAVGCIFVDVTEKQKATKELKTALKKLEKSNEELSQFAYVASHDLQEPLNTVIGFSNLLKDEYTSKLDDKGKQFIDLITSSTYRMKELIKDILDYSRIEKNIELEEFSLNELIQNILNDMDTNIKEKQAIIKIGQLPEKVLGYKTNFRMLLQNLISNALKFNDSKPPSIEISYHNQPNYHQFSVKDNGIGIDPQYNKKIFEIFQRLHNKRIYKGTGIGLAHCKKVVEMHKGDIWVESKENQGSNFIFTTSKSL